LQPSSESEDADEADLAESSELMDELDAHAAAEDARADAAFEDAKADNRSVHLSRRGALLAQIRPYAMALCASPLFRGSDQSDSTGSGSGGGFGGGASVFDAIATDLTELVSLLSFNQPVPFLNEPEWRLVALTLLVLLGDRPQCAPALRPRGLCAAAFRFGGSTENMTANLSQQGRATSVASNMNGGVHALLRELQFEAAHLECLVDAVKFDY
jgi:hypothetical protein